MDAGLVKGAESIALFCRLLINEKKELPIRSSEMGLLILAAKNEEPVTPVMAAGYFKVSKPMIAAMVRSLEEKGLLRKNPSLRDKRSFTLEVTEAGKALVDSTYAAYYSTMQLLQEKLGRAPFQNLIALLDAANTILWEEKNNGQG